MIDDVEDIKITNIKSCLGFAIGIFGTNQISILKNVRMNYEKSLRENYTVSFRCRGALYDFLSWDWPLGTSVSEITWSISHTIFEMIEKRLSDGQRNHFDRLLWYSSDYRSKAYQKKYEVFDACLQLARI